MALPTLSLTINDYPSGKDQTHSKVQVFGQLGIGTGGLYQTSGLPLSFAGYEFAPVSPDQAIPVFATFYSASTGFEYAYDPVHQTLRIYEQGVTAGPLPELASGASVTADTVYFQLIFNKS
ncbi:MAG: hypothetical protein ACREKE_07900 [bacterium]